MTVHQALQQARDRFQEAQLVDADPSAHILLAFLLNKRSNELFLYGSEELPVDIEKQYNDLVSRRAQHEPIWYIIGLLPFAGVPIYADKRVLIPRQETEQLVVLALNKLLDLPADHQLQILEVGTGSGAISCALARFLKQQHRDFQITATDISRDALQVAKKNVAANHFDKSIMLVQSDLLAAITEKNYDLIIANLPYVPTDRLHHLESEVKDYEPHLALDGGPDGLNIYRTLFQQLIEKQLNFHALFLEIDESHSQAIKKIAEAFWPQGRSHVSQDLSGLDRYLQIDLSK